MMLGDSRWFYSTETDPKTFSLFTPNREDTCIPSEYFWVLVACLLMEWGGETVKDDSPIAGSGRRHGQREMVQGEHYSTLLDAINESITIWRNGRVAFANSRMAGLIGCLADDLMSTDPMALIHAEDKSEVCEGYAKILSGSSISWKGLFRLIRNDGTGV
jgi:PAS domain S-box-containing protein